MMEETLLEKRQERIDGPSSGGAPLSQPPGPRYHIPVLCKESILGLNLKRAGTYVDCTLGDGGHFQAIIDGLGPGATAIGLDRDPAAVSECEKHIASKAVRVIFKQERFSRFDAVLDGLHIDAVDGIFMDLGLSTRQIVVGERGFSYMKNVKLDMRMDPKDPKTAADLLRDVDKKQLVHILAEYGEIINPQRMAETILRYREKNVISTTDDLKSCLRQEYGENLNFKMLAKLFQALRIAVNDELSELRLCCERAIKRLLPGGRLAVIAYHSLEDRFVKNFMRDAEKNCQCPPTVMVCACEKQSLLKRITKKAIKPSDEEVALNPASRSARLRVAERTMEVKP
jgi:16S rRNA (cytosine1402-N4)-methyltransferase